MTTAETVEINHTAVISFATIIWQCPTHDNIRARTALSEEIGHGLNNLYTRHSAGATFSCNSDIKVIVGEMFVKVEYIKERQLSSAEEAGVHATLEIGLNFKFPDVGERRDSSPKKGTKSLSSQTITKSSHKTKLTQNKPQQNNHHQQ